MMAISRIPRRLWSRSDDYGIMTYRYPMESRTPDRLHVIVGLYSFLPTPAHRQAQQLAAAELQTKR